MQNFCQHIRKRLVGGGGGGGRSSSRSRSHSRSRSSSSTSSKVVPYLITNVGHGVNPGFLAVSPQVTLVKIGGKLLLLSTQPAVIYLAKDWNRYTKYRDIVSPNVLTDRQTDRQLDVQPKNITPLHLLLVQT